MSTDPNATISASSDAIDDLVSAPAEQISQERAIGFQMMKNKMLEVYANKLKTGKTPILVRGAQLQSYRDGLNDSFDMFTKIIDEQEGISG